MARTGGHAFLDRPAARGLSALVLVLCIGLLAFIHRDDFRTLADPTADQEDVAADSADPAAPCIARRVAEIDGMIDDGIIENEQAELFKQRAEAMCRATEGDGAGASPPLPVE